MKTKMAVTVCRLSCQCVTMIFPDSEQPIGLASYLSYLSALLALSLGVYMSMAQTPTI